MANLNFFASADDLRSLLQYLFAETDVVIYEFTSGFNSELCQFRSLEELEKKYCLGTYRSPYLALWSPSVMARIEIRRVVASALPGQPYRFEPAGVGLMQLYLNGVKDNILHESHFGHWNEAGARQRSIYDPDECDWSALAKLSGRIQRHIRGKLASAKLYAMPILHHAYSAVQGGVGLWAGPAIHHGDSSAIVVNHPNKALPRSAHAQRGR